MRQVQQDIMCALLQVLLKEELITQDIHDKARGRILDSPELPELFRDGE